MAPPSPGPPGRAEGWLHAYEIVHWDLNAQLVVLSGCETGLGKFRRGEGLLGMSRAFLYAGAPSLVASLWPIADGPATLTLMQTFYDGLAQGRDKRSALQQAQIRLLRAGYTHPFYWASFILLGEAGPIPIEKPSSSARFVLIFLIAATLVGIARRAIRKITTRPDRPSIGRTSAPSAPLR